MNEKNSRVLQKASPVLGEGPVWNARHDALFWIDVEGPAIHRHLITGGTIDDEAMASGSHASWSMPSAIGAIATTRNSGRLVVALEHEGICLFDPEDASLEPIADPVASCGLAGIAGRYNDGIVDPLGNFWVGWLTHDRKRPGAIFRIDSGGVVKKVLDDLVAPNGIGWSSDGAMIYVTDSATNTIWAHDCDLETATLGQGGILARQPRSRGIFDGLCIDENGHVYSALYGGGAVVRISPSGEELQRIRVPASLVTSCCFAGRDLKTLVITSAVRNQGARELEKYPLSGSLFYLPLATAGMPADDFAYG